MSKTITVPTDWSDIKVKDYDAVTKLINDNTLDMAEKELGLISIVTGLPVEDVKKLELESYNAIKAKTSFMTEKIKPKHPTQSFTLNGKRYRAVFDPSKMTAAEFLDYKSILEHTEMDKRLARLLACFIIPGNCDYGEGYEIEDVVNDIWNHMSVQEVTGFADFFIVTFRSYVDSILEYSTRQLKRVKRMSQEEKEATLEQLRRAKLLLQNGGLYR